MSPASSSEPVRLTGVAMLVWLCLTEEQNTDTLVDSVANMSGLSRERVEAAALDALQRLVDLGGVVAP